MRCNPSETLLMHVEILEMSLLILIALGPVVLLVVLPGSFGRSKDIQKMSSYFQDA